MEHKRKNERENLIYVTHKPTQGMAVFPRGEAATKHWKQEAVPCTGAQVALITNQHEKEAGYKRWPGSVQITCVVNEEKKVTNSE
jgi:hypothetical protein